MAKNTQAQLNKEESLKAIVAGFSNSIKELADWKEALHQQLITCLLHTCKFYDARGFQYLLDNIGELKGADRQALVKWLQEYSSCHINKDGDSYHVKYNKNGRNTADDINGEKGAKAIKWWAFKPTSEWQGFALHDELVKLKSKASKAVKKAAKEGEEKLSIDADEQEVLNALCEGKAHVIAAMLRQAKQQAA